jgi:TatD DNase family protein
MNTSLPPIDAHAHVKTGVPAVDLANLGCAVLAVTREAREWPMVARRSDEMTLWGVGCHPGYPGEITRFSAEDFRQAMHSTALVGEVGLDARSKSPMREQREVFDQVLELVGAEPRLISIHSLGASKMVLDALEQRPQKAAILHWWRGSEDETKRAIELGCYFSINGAEVRRPKVITLLPKERALTETDFPFTEHTDRAATRPGAVATTEAAFEEIWGLDRAGVRFQVWQNLRDLCAAANCASNLPSGIAQGLRATVAV